MENKKFLKIARKIKYYDWLTDEMLLQIKEKVENTLWFQIERFNEERRELWEAITNGIKAFIK